MNEWNWLKKHFLSPQFQKLSVVNSANRDKLTMHHHASCTPFIYNADKLRSEVESLYLINGFEVAYDAPHNEIAAKKANDMRQKILTMLSEQQPDTPKDKPLQQVDLCSQLDAFEKVLGTRGIKGLGRVEIEGKERVIRRSCPNDVVLEEV